MLPVQKTLLCSLISGLILLTPAEAKTHWLITQTMTGFSYDTQTGIASRHGVNRPGLVTVARSKGNLMQSYWQPGAYRATVAYNGLIIIDGFDIQDVSRIRGFRFDKAGSTVYLRSTKGPGAIVELYQDEQPVLSWPRRSLITILSYRKKGLHLVVYDKAGQTTEFWHYTRSAKGALKTTGQKIGQMKGCVLMGSKVLKKGIALEAYCQMSRGSDVKFLDFSTGKVSDILATGADEFLGFGLVKTQKKTGMAFDKQTIPVLSVSGNNAGRQFYHGVSASLLKLLGEPMSVASDESGKQSWSQSYRTLTLATLYQKTGHKAFAELTRRAMGNTLDQQNKALGIKGKFNPSCAWASRIYSDDGQSPISFMVNQAMISASLIKSCDRLKDACSSKLRRRIKKNAFCLVRSYEKWFDQDSGLYRIPYKAPFRFDGIWAPWNWHMMWSVVLQYVAKESGKDILRNRTQNIVTRFLDSWEIKALSKPQALWRYWTAPYYAGWQKTDHISSARPAQKARNMTKERYEDLNHAGISLLGLSTSVVPLRPERRQAATNTLDHLLSQGGLLARDMDGRGPVSPRWLPGAGWHMFATEKMRDLYAHRLPGSASSDQQLAYALLFPADGAFELTLALSHCVKNICTPSVSWSYQTAAAFLAHNPIFQLRPK